MGNMGPVEKRQAALRSICDRQCGYFTAIQAKEAGYTAQNHPYHVEKGHWLKVGYGIYRLPGYEDGMLADFFLCSLWSRNKKDQPQAVISHDSALALYGLGQNHGTIHVTVPMSFRKNAPDEYVIHKKSLGLSVIESRGGVMVTRLAQTLHDVKDELESAGIWSQTVSQAVDLQLLSADEAVEFGAHQQVLPAGAEKAKGAKDSHEKNKVFFNADTNQYEEESAGGKITDSLSEGVWKMIFDRSEAGRRRASAGFTLVELLVVIAIISILASMLMPALSSVMAVSRRTSCMNLEKQFALTDSNYSGDFNGWHWPHFTGPTTARTYWYANQYLRDSLGLSAPVGDARYWPKSYVCPEATLSLADTGPAGTCSVLHSIGVNITNPGNGGSEWYPAFASDHRAFHDKEIGNKPSQKLLFVDSTDQNVVMGRSYAETFYFALGEYYSGTTDSAVTAYRHDRGANVAYFDYHVAYKGFADISGNMELWRLDK